MIDEVVHVWADVSRQLAHPATGLYVMFDVDANLPASRHQAAPQLDRGGCMARQERSTAGPFLMP